jgi:DNA repair protein RadC
VPCCHALCFRWVFNALPRTAVFLRGGEEQKQTAGHERQISKKTLMKNQIYVEEPAPANANQLISSAKGARAKSVSDRMAKLGEFRILTLRETPAYGKAENPEHSADYWRKNIATDPRHNPDVESLVCLVLNTRRDILGHFLVATGLLDTILCHPREVFRPAIVANAAAIVVMHNHPSGDATPSEADIKVTRDLIRAGQLLKIELCDHVIMGRATNDRPGHQSLRALGYFHQ